MQRKYSLTSAVLALAITLIVVFGSTWATTAAAQALPGDTLFAVKTGFEEARVVVSTDAGNDARLHMLFAEKRLEEMRTLIDARRYEDLKAAAEQFEFHIQEAIKSLSQVAAADPVAGEDLANAVTEALSRYATLLADIQTMVPATAQPAIEQAIQASHPWNAPEEMEITGLVEHIGPNSWVIGGRTFQVQLQTEIKNQIQLGDTVNVHAMINPDGSLTAREIALAGDQAVNQSPNTDDGTLNGNANDGNMNDDDNGNANDDDGNMNDDNGNANDDDGNNNQNDDNHGDGHDNDHDHDEDHNDNGHGDNDDHDDD